MDPKAMIVEDYVKKALKADKGDDACLKSWKVVDFAKLGDNYASAVTSIEVEYSTSINKDCIVTYIAKMNPQMAGEFQEYEPYLFSKESQFYEELIPQLNEVLISAGHQPLRYPKCYFVSLEEGKQQIYLEDLRPRGFKMVDRRKGLDKHHVSLVITELARLHSASHLLTQKHMNGESAASKYECLSKDLLDFTPNIKELILTWFQNNVDTGVLMLENVDGYEKAIEYLKSFKSEVESVFTLGIQSERLNSICHGDIWSNNILFRYDKEGFPVEVMLLDLQNCREASVASDLNYLLFTSVLGDVRNSNLDEFMSLYHSTYKDVLKGGNMPMSFTKEDIIAEYRDKNKYGLLFALFLLPFVLSEPKEAPKMSDQDFDSVMTDFRKISIENMKTNPLCKPRFLAVFDELMETGLIS